MKIHHFNTKMAKMALSSDIDTLIEEKQALMVSPPDGKPTFRIAHFLKPSFSSSSNQSQTIFNPPSVPPSKPISPILKSLTSNVYFNGWKHPLNNWNLWVEKLRPLYESIWKKASIFDAIMCSTLEIPKCRPSIFGLAEKWCSETNSFVLPWGEVTITLEDIMVLGGFSVTGDSVLCELSSKKLLEMEEKLLIVRNGMMRSKSKKASQQQWLDIWMGKGSEFEHEAFLSYWLSRYVLPADDCGTINKSVFQIAVLLARGHKIALAPAVLASLYRDLRLLKEKIVSIRELSDHDDANLTKLAVWAPFQLLQVWIWERFQSLSPKPNSVINGLTRLERWHKVKVSKRDDVGVLFDSGGDEFRWRPYSTPLNNWSFELVLESYGRCIRVSILVGLDCMEPYFPHRVAMQFGLDQDIPVACPRLSDKTETEIAWSNYNRPIGDVKLYMPPKLFESDVTVGYLDWWKKSKVVKGSASSCERKKEGSSKMSMDVVERMRIKIENNEAEVPPGFTPIGKRVAVETDGSSHDHQPSSKKSRHSQDVPVIDIESSDSDASPGSSVQIKEVKRLKIKGDSDDDDLTLSQLLRVKSIKSKSRSDALPISYRESPISSAGDNASIQETNSAAKYTGHILPSENCTREGLTVEDGTESKAGSPIRSAISVDKNESQARFSGARESSDIDLLDRIARLQRIIDMVKTTNINQA